MGLDHAHKNGIVHRDVKPGNILVKNDGTVKVVDFGIVHLETTTLTKTGMFMGTIQYASPEQLNEGKVDQRSDLWSVVAVIYELIAYKKPFEGSNFGAMVGQDSEFGTRTPQLKGVQECPSSWTMSFPKASRKRLGNATNHWKSSWWILRRSGKRFSVP